MIKNVFMAIIIIVSVIALGYGAYWLYNVVIEDVTNKIRISVSQGVSEGISQGVGSIIKAPFSLPAKLFNDSN